MRWARSRARRAAVGVTLLVLGANEEEEIEDVLAAAPRPPVLSPLATAGGRDDSRQ